MDVFYYFSLILSIELVVLLIYIISTILVTYGIIMICSNAIIFSRLVFCLALGYGLTYNYDHLIIPGNALWSFIACSAILFAGVLLFTYLLPRVGLAIQFFCTAFISPISVIMLVSLLNIGEAGYGISKSYEIVIKVICGIIALIATAWRGESVQYRFHLSKIVQIIERLIASAGYSAGIVYLMISLKDNWHLSGIMHAVWFVVFIVIIYLADLFLFTSDT